MNKTILSLALAVAATMPATAAYTTTSTEDLKVWYEFPTIIADGETVNYIKVYEHHDGYNYTAFNMHFVLPTGFTVNTVKQGRETVNDITLSARAASTHSIVCNLLDDGQTLKIWCDSSQNDDLYADDEDGNPLDLLFTLGLIASPDMAAGEYQTYLDGILFVFKDGNASEPSYAPIYGTIVVENSGTSGIEAVSSDQLDPADCYNLQGIKVDPSKVSGTIVISRGRKVYVK